MLTGDPILLLATTQEHYAEEEMKTLQDCYWNPTEALNASNLSREVFKCSHKGVLAEYSTFKMYEHTQACKIQDRKRWSHSK